MLYILFLKGKANCTHILSVRTALINDIE